MAQEAASEAQELEVVAVHLGVAKYYMLACVAALWYDIMLTFATEVDRIWRQSWSGAKALWFIHRYYNPLLYIITVSLAIDPIWPTKTCESIVLYPVISQLVSQFFISIILTLRTYALYGKSNLILASLIFTYLCCLVAQWYPLQFGIRIPLPHPLVGCILGGTPESGLSLISYWIGNTIFDTVVFILTIYKTLSLYRTGHRLPLITLLLRDGALYFGAIFCANTMTVLTYAFAPATLKVLHATFAHVVAVILVSHLMLNLKQQGGGGRNRLVVHEGGKIKFEDTSRRSTSYHRGTEGHYRERVSIGEFAVDRSMADGGRLAKRLSNFMGPLIYNPESRAGERKKEIEIEMGLAKQAYHQAGRP